MISYEFNKATFPAPNIFSTPFFESMLFYLSDVAKQLTFASENFIVARQNKYLFVFIKTKIH